MIRAMEGIKGTYKGQRVTLVTDMNTAKLIQDSDRRVQSQRPLHMWRFGFQRGVMVSSRSQLGRPA